MAAASLGERIKELRMGIGMSLRTLAGRIDKSPPFVSDIELGRRYPSDEVLETIATVLGVAFEDLKTLDTRSSLDDLKRLAQRDPQWGMAFRAVASKAETLSPEEFMRLLTEKKHDP
jgi:transcriptional regulator with XRE-family HTH domain